MVETVVTTIEDEFHFKVKKFIKRREILVLIVCVFTFFFSLPNICPVYLYFIIIISLVTIYAFKGGIYYFTIVDFFSAGVSLFYIAFFEIIAIVWIYGNIIFSLNKF